MKNWRPAWYVPIAARRALKAELDRLTGANALLKEEAESGRCRTIAECTRICHRLHIAEARLASIDVVLPTRDEVLAELQSAVGETEA